MNIEKDCINIVLDLIGNTGSKKYPRKTAAAKIAPIAAVMPFCSLGFEALARHLSGKRDRGFSELNGFASKKIIEKMSTYYFNTLN